MNFDSLRLPEPPVIESPAGRARCKAGGLVALVASPEELPRLGDECAALLDAARRERLLELLNGRVFSGASKESMSIPAPGGGTLLLQGVGSHRNSLSEAWRCAGAALARHCRGGRALTLVFPGSGPDAGDQAAGVLTGLGLALYEFSMRKSSGSRGAAKAFRVKVLAPAMPRRQLAGACEEAASMLEGVYAARNVANAPPNLLPPLVFAAIARKWGEEAGLKVRVHREPRLKALRMGLLLAVARGSAQRPALIEMIHGKRTKGRPTVLLVGKGVTFDAGGISLKRSDSMDKMRYDMSGGAAVMGTMIAIARLELPIHVIGIIPAVENMPGSRAYRPGDVLAAMNGLTVEVLNTDAEGRLILADALSYGSRFKPDLVVDLATLTGAVRSALGSHMAAMLGTAPEAMGLLGECGQETHERVWPLPLDEDYDEMIKGGAADLKNLGGPHAGTITAAQFLKHFAGSFPWIHMDIAGVAYDDPKRPYAKGKGASGFGVRLLVHFLGRFAERV